GVDCNRVHRGSPHGEPPRGLLGNNAPLPAPAPPGARKPPTPFPLRLRPGPRASGWSASGVGLATALAALAGGPRRQEGVVDAGVVCDAAVEQGHRPVLAQRMRGQSTPTSVPTSQ